jgi:hypothetical protein
MSETGLLAAVQVLVVSSDAVTAGLHSQFPARFQMSMRVPPIGGMMTVNQLGR